METDVLIVTHNSYQHLGKCLQSIPENVHVILWDNNSDDTSYLKSIKRKNFKLILSKVNIGFGAAHNKLVLASSNKFVFILNPDTELGPETIINLQKFAIRSKFEVALNPKIIDSQGKIFQKSKSHILPSSVDITPKWSCACDAFSLKILSGSAIFLKRQTILRIGGFDEKIFMYFEDDDLSVRLSKSGTMCLRVDEAVIVHHAGEGSAPSFASIKIKNFHWARSRIYAARKHKVRGAFAKGLAESIRYQFKNTRHGRTNTLFTRPYLLAGSISALFLKNDHDKL